jgi:hypothetical protein
MAGGPFASAVAAQEVPGVTDDAIRFGSFGTLNGQT